jgi:hypothetical protein
MKTAALVVAALAVVSVPTPAPAAPDAPANAAAPAPDPAAPVACEFKGDPQTCFPYGCVPVDAAGNPVPLDNPDLVPPGGPGRCGVCTTNDECGGAKCRKPGEEGAGTCVAHDKSPAPRPFRPRFGLMVAELSFNLADADDTRPIVGAGFLGQLSLETARPAVRQDGPGFIIADPPRWYADLGATAAFAGPAQNLFVSLGVTYYLFSGPLALSTVTAGALYQRQGSAIWELDSDKNRDRLGPALTLGFMQNLYLRGAYVFGLAGPDHHGAVIVSLIYMRDLFDDLASDRFRKYLPKAMQGK